MQTINEIVAEKMIAAAVRTMTADEYEAAVALEAEIHGLYLRCAPDILADMQASGADPHTAAVVLAHFDPDEVLSRAIAPPCRDCAVDADPPVTFDVDPREGRSVAWVILGVMAVVTAVVCVLLRGW